MKIIEKVQHVTKTNIYFADGRTRYCPFVVSMPISLMNNPQFSSHASTRTKYRLLPEPYMRPTTCLSHLADISSFSFLSSPVQLLYQKQLWRQSDCGTSSEPMCQHTQEQQQLQEKDEGFCRHRRARSCRLRHGHWSGGCITSLRLNESRLTPPACACFT